MTYRSIVTILLFTVLTPVAEAAKEKSHLVLSVIASMVSRTPFQQRCQDLLSDEKEKARATAWEALREVRNLLDLENFQPDQKLRHYTHKHLGLDQKHRATVARFLASIESDLLAGDFSTLVVGEILKGPDVFKYFQALNCEIKRLDQLVQDKSKSEPALSVYSLAAILAEGALIVPVGLEPNLATLAYTGPFLALNSFFGIYPLIRTSLSGNSYYSDKTFRAHLRSIEGATLSDESTFSYFHREIPLPTRIQEDMRQRSLSDSQFCEICTAYYAKTYYEGWVRFFQTLYSGGFIESHASLRKNFPREHSMRDTVIDQIFYFKDQEPHLLTYIRTVRDLRNSGAQPPKKKPFEVFKPGLVPGAN